MVLSKHRPFLLAGLAVGLVVAITAACGGGDSSSSGTSSPNKTTAATTKTTGTANQDAAAEIDQDNLTFKPSKVTVKVGENVRFKNSESAIHTVNIDGKNISGNMKKGDQLYWKAPKAGNYKVSCDYHPQMSATVTVQ